MDETDASNVFDYFSYENESPGFVSIKTFFSDPDAGYLVSFQHSYKSTDSSIVNNFLYKIDELTLNLLLAVQFDTD